MCDSSLFSFIILLPLVTGYVTSICKSVRVAQNSAAAVTTRWQHCRETFGAIYLRTLHVVQSKPTSSNIACSAQNFTFKII